MEYGYKEYRKDSQSSLRDKEATGQKPLSHFKSSEERQKKQMVPQEKMLLKNTYGALNLGKASQEKEKDGETKKQQEEKLITVSGVRQGEDTTLRDYDEVRETGSVFLPNTNKRAVTNPHDRENSAVAIKLKEAESGERAVKHLEQIAEHLDQQVLRQTLPFLLQKQEEGQIKELEEQRAIDGGLSEERERYLTTLKINQIHKQQKKQELIKKINQTLAEKERIKESSKSPKKRNRIIELLMIGAAAIENTTEDETEIDIENDTETEDEIKKPDKSGQE